MLEQIKTRFREWNSESRMRENRLSGLMRGGQQTVLSRLLPAYSTEALWERGCSRNFLSLGVRLCGSGCSYGRRFMVERIGKQSFDSRGVPKALR